jgi:hypothetical protein
LIIKIGGVSLVGRKYFLSHVAHNGSVVEELMRLSCYRRLKTGAVIYAISDRSFTGRAANAEFAFSGH